MRRTDDVLRLADPTPEPPGGARWVILLLIIASLLTVLAPLLLCLIALWNHRLGY